MLCGQFGGQTAPKNEYFEISQENIRPATATPTKDEHPEMCFWSQIGQILRIFIVRNMGIKADPTKIKAIMEPPALKRN